MTEAANGSGPYYTDLRKFLDTSVSSISGHIAGASYRAGEAGAQPTAQSERIRRDRRRTGSTPSRRHR